MLPIDVSDTSFEADVIQSNKPVVLDFWAPWCGPCKKIAPILESLAQKMGDKVTIAKMNVDENPSTPSKFGVRGIPMLALFKDGAVVSTKVGLLPEAELESWINGSI